MTNATGLPYNDAVQFLYQYIKDGMKNIRSHSFSTYAKFSEKHTCAYQRVCITDSGNIPASGKISLKLFMAS